MEREELVKTGYEEEEICAKSWAVNAIWAVCAISMIAYVFAFMGMAGAWKESKGAFADFMRFRA